MNDTAKDVEFYRLLWERLAGQEFSVGKLANRLRLDGGVDVENLSHADICDLIEGSYSRSWSEVAFSFSEILATYSVPSGIQTGEQIVGWVCASFVIADAIRNDATDWEMEFNKFIDGFMVVRDRLETEESINVFQRVFRSDLAARSEFSESS